MTESYPRSFIRDNFIVIFGTALVYMKGLILMPIIIKSVGVTIYGGFILLSSLLSIVFGISSLGAGYKAKRFLPSTLRPEERGQLFYPQFFFQLSSIIFLSALLILLSDQINQSFFKTEVNYSLIIIPVYLISYFLYAQGTDYFRYTSRITAMILGTLFFPYVHIGFLLLFLNIYHYLNVNVLILSQACSALLVMIPCFWVIAREVGPRLSFYKIQTLVNDIKLGFPLILGFLIDFILAGSDRYVIAFYLTISAVGYYNPGYVLGSVILFIPKAMGTVLPQLLSKAVDHKRDSEAYRMLDYALKSFLLVAIPFIFGCLVLGEQILSLLANHEVARNGYLVAPFVALGMLFCGLNMILSNVLFVRMRTLAILNVNLFVAVFNLIANIVGLYFFRHILTSAIVTMLSYFIVFLLIWRIARKDWPIGFDRTVIVKSILASLIMGILLSLMSAQNYRINILGSAGLLVVELILGLTIYVLSLLLLRAISKQEFQFIQRMIKDSYLGYGKTPA